MADLSIQQDILEDAFTHDLDAAALSHSTTFATDFRLSFVSVNRVGAGPQATFETYFDSGTSSNYDILIDSSNLPANGGLLITPPGVLFFKSGDEIRVEAASVGTSVDLYITIHGVQA